MISDVSIAFPCVYSCKFGFRCPAMVLCYDIFHFSTLLSHAYAMLHRLQRTHFDVILVKKRRVNLEDYCVIHHVSNVAHYQFRQSTAAIKPADFISMICSLIRMPPSKYLPLFVQNRSSSYLRHFMGWFSSSKPEKPTVASRRERTKCWESRDAYFACLDGIGIVKAGEEGKACAVQAAQYEENCAKSWV